MGHDQESSWRPVGGAQFRIDRLHTIEGDGGQLFVETETGGDADGQFGELGGDFDDIARQVLLYIDAVDEEIGLNGDRGCACGDTFCDRFGDGGAAVVEEAGPRRWVLRRVRGGGRPAGSWTRRCRCAGCRGR